MPDLKWARVRDKDTGHEYSVIESAVDEKTVTVLDNEHAVDNLGEPLPPKYAGTQPVAESDDKSGYEAMKKDELEAEIGSRNSDRAEADQIVVGGNGNKPDLIAALVADDANLES